MLGLGLTFDPSLLVAHLREKGLIAVGAARNTLRLLPPLTVKDDEIVRALNILRSGIVQIKMD
jgi:4-aminobutyrate aminotransferase-like enzyme